MDSVVAAHAHRQSRGPHRPVSAVATPWSTLAGLAFIGACARTSAPAPASESLQPVQSAPVAVAMASPLTSTAPSASPNTAPTPHQPALASAGASAAPVVALGACDELEASRQFRELPPDARARSRASCAAKEEFAAFLAARQACASATDCTVVPGSCPFGCFVPAANAAAAEVTAKLTALGERLDKTGNRCVYRCMGPPAPRCVEHRCRAGSP
jgi:hypothetical protein